MTIGIAPASSVDLTDEVKRRLYRTMLRIRVVEERIGELYAEQQMRCPCHLSIGQEAVAAGACVHLHRDDFLFGTYRGHGLYLAQGGDLTALLAELYGKATGCTQGRGGSMQLIAPEVGLICTSAIVGGTIPMAVGAALSAQVRGTRQIALVVFGDGATEEGVFHESMNFASLKRLPVIFVCENNFYACYSHQSARQCADNIAQRAMSYAVPGTRVDGNDVAAVSQVVGEAVRRARDGEGPSLIECRTYRWREHVGPADDTPLGYRSADELKAWMARCPVERWAKALQEEGIATPQQLRDVRLEIEQELERAVIEAKRAPDPRVDDLARGVYMESIS